MVSATEIAQGRLDFPDPVDGVLEKPLKPGPLLALIQKVAATRRHSPEDGASWVPPAPNGRSPGSRESSPATSQDSAAEIHTPEDQADQADQERERSEVPGASGHGPELDPAARWLAPAGEPASTAPASPTLPPTAPDSTRVEDLDRRSVPETPDEPGIPAQVPASKAEDDEPEATPSYGPATGDSAFQLLDEVRETLRRLGEVIKIDTVSGLHFPGTTSWNAWPGR